MLTVFTDVVLPVFVVASLGFLLQRTLRVSVEPLSQVTLYLFSPALAFNSLTKSTIKAEDAFQILGFAVAFAAVMYLAAWIMARAARLDRAMESAFLLSALLMNSGNYGLSVVLLAFGQPGLERGVIFFVCQATLAGTLGVFLASRSQAGVLAALSSVFRMPLVYAALAAVAVNLFQIPLPPFLSKSAEIAGSAAIPTMLMVLGMQLSRSSSLESPLAVSMAIFARLVLSVGIALLLVGLMGIGGLTRDVLIIQSSMPTAVITIILATQFNARPRFVTSVVLSSTAVSIVTVTILLSALLGKGPTL